MNVSKGSKVQATESIVDGAVIVEVGELGTVLGLDPADRFAVTVAWDSGVTTCYLGDEGDCVGIAFA